MAIKTIVNSAKKEMVTGLLILLFCCHVLLILIYMGIWTIIPSYVQIFSNWIHMVMGIYLIIRFNPIQQDFIMTAYDKALVCSAGIFILEALLATVIFTSQWEKQVTEWLKQYQTKMMTIIKPFLTIMSYKDVTKTNGDIEIDNFLPHDAESSLGGAPFTLGL